MKSKSPGYWTQDTIQKEALKYQYRSDFRKNSASAYNKAYTLGILDIVCSHLKRRDPPNKYWTVGKVLDVAKKYEYKRDFIKNERSAYIAAFNLKIADKVLRHMKEHPRSLRIHSYEDSLAKIKKCRSIAEFKAKYKKEYGFIQRKKLFKKIYKERGFETPDKTASTGEISFRSYINRLLNINLKKSTNITWLVSAKGTKLSLDGYDKNNKIAFEFNGYRHQDSAIKETDRLKRRECAKRGIRLITIEDFVSDEFYKRINSLKEQLFKEINRLNLKIANYSSKFKIIYNGARYTDKEILLAVGQCERHREFRDKFPNMFAFIHRRNKLHLVAILPKGKKLTSYTYQEIITAAKKCKNMNEFQKTYTSKYNFTLKNKNHHAKIQNFFKIKKMIKDKELKNEIWKTVKRTKTYTEFGSKHNALKHQAKRLKILPQIKKHYKIAN